MISIFLNFVFLILYNISLLDFVLKSTFRHNFSLNFFLGLLLLLHSLWRKKIIVHWSFLLVIHLTSNLTLVEKFAVWTLPFYSFCLVVDNLANYIVKWTRDYTADRFGMIGSQIYTDTHIYDKYFLTSLAWRLSVIGPIIVGLFAVYLISRATDTKLHGTLNNQSNHSFLVQFFAYVIQFFVDYDFLTPSTYPSYVVAFFIGFVTCYAMIFLADKENTNGQRTFRFFLIRKVEEMRC